MLVALAGILGLVLGSFVAGMTWRWPRGEAFLGGRSRCADCGRVLGVAELVPAVSWLVLRGRCRGCGAVVPARHLMIELAAAGVCAGSVWAAPGVWDGVAGGVFGLILLVLLVLDVEHFWLPDGVVLALAGLGLAFGVGEIGEKLVGLVMGFGVFWGISAGYRRVAGREGMGAGDPKLLGAIGAWLGWAALPLVVLGASVLGLVLVGVDRMRGRAVAGDMMVPLGALMAAVAWPLWVVMVAGGLEGVLP